MSPRFVKVVKSFKGRYAGRRAYSHPAAYGRNNKVVRVKRGYYQIVTKKRRRY